MRETKMRKLIAVFLLLAFRATLAAGGAQERAPASRGFLLIVNARNPISSLDRKFVADTFFKRVTRWPEDGVIQPVDQRPESAARRRFSEAVLNRSVNGVKSYWQQLIFSGVNVPPPELKDDQDVLRYVTQVPGAIGYVSATFAGDGTALSGVKTVELR
jgi:ABC-type phosphate transport system substrate-binding protein